MSRPPILDGKSTSTRCRDKRAREGRCRDCGSKDKPLASLRSCEDCLNKNRKTDNLKHRWKRKARKSYE